MRLLNYHTIHQQRMASGIYQINGAVGVICPTGGARMVLPYQRVMSEPATFYDAVNNDTAAEPERGTNALATMVHPVPSPVALPAIRALEPSDWSQWYLRDEDDDVGQSSEHLFIVDALFHLCQELARERGWESAHVGSDQFIGWKQEHRLVRVSPDVYITDSPLARMPSSWETWLPGHRAPRFAVEVVSRDWRKDYTENPNKYASMGAAELVLVDPYAFSHPRRAQQSEPKRVPLQVYRLDPDGLPLRVAAGSGPVHCAEIDAYLLFCTGRCSQPWVRISRDAAGRDLVPTADERAAAQAARADATAVELVEAKAELGAAKARASVAEAELGAALALLRKHGLA
jgi:Uma2 family endonuclease